MKKKSKIILCSLIGGLILVGGGIGVGVAIDNSNDQISGTLVAGSGEYDWRKYDVRIEPEKWLYDKYYTNCDDDCIDALHFIVVQNGFQIDYSNDFNIFDDFDACFVISKYDGSESITTDVERSHSPIGDDDIFTYYENAYRTTWYITEVWVRTVD